jgi:hypothetical protein
VDRQLHKAEAMNANAMRLLPIAYPAHENIRGVQFAMLDFGELVHVLVTNAALDRVEEPVASGGNHLARFAKHRDRFEQVANDKYIRGQAEPSGSIAVLPSDL